MKTISIDIDDEKALVLESIALRNNKSCEQIVSEQIIQNVENTINNWIANEKTTQFDNLTLTEKVNVLMNIPQLKPVSTNIVAKIANFFTA